jgi:hypothetical protein
MDAALCGRALPDRDRLAERDAYAHADTGNDIHSSIDSRH